MLTWHFEFFARYTEKRTRISVNRNVRLRRLHKQSLFSFLVSVNPQTAVIPAFFAVSISIPDLS